MGHSKNSNSSGWSVLKIVTDRGPEPFIRTMADQKLDQQSVRGQGSTKIDMSEVSTTKDNDFGDVVTLNVGGKR